jgi:hypothetical protein
MTRARLALGIAADCTASYILKNYFASRDSVTIQVSTPQFQPMLLGRRAEAFTHLDWLCGARRHLGNVPPSITFTRSFCNTQIRVVPNHRSGSPSCRQLIANGSPQLSQGGNDPPFLVRDAPLVKRQICRFSENVKGSRGTKKFSDDW